MRRLEILGALDRRLDYDGSQLRPHFIRQTFGLLGDAAVAFRGKCHVTGMSLVDLEDREAGAFIHAREMVHVLVERFEPDLVRMVLVQRLLSSLVAERVRRAVDASTAAQVSRSGDDVYVGDGKLTVSIATVSPVSALLHLGVNVDDRDAPIRTASLGTLGIEPDAFAQGLLEDLQRELEGVALATCKVSPVLGEGTHG